MIKVRCERVENGLRKSEAIVTIRDIQGRRHFLRVERNFLTHTPDASFLPVAFIHQDPHSKAVLIELPHEAETGANRLWVSEESLWILPRGLHDPVGSGNPCRDGTTRLGDQPGAGRGRLVFDNG